jgi:hypothetical protein
MEWLPTVSEADLSLTYCEKFGTWRSDPHVLLGETVPQSDSPIKVCVVPFASGMKEVWRTCPRRWSIYLAIPVPSSELPTSGERWRRRETGQANPSFTSPWLISQHRGRMTIFPALIRLLQTTVHQGRAVEQDGFLPGCLSVCVQRVALRTPTPFERTLSLPKSASRLFEVRTPAPRQAWVPSTDSIQSPKQWVAMAHPLGKHVPQTADKPEKTEPNTIFNKVILIGRLGQNAEAKTAQNSKGYVVLNIATQETWKNEKGDYEEGTEWHRV